VERQRSEAATLREEADTALKAAADLQRKARHQTNHCSQPGYTWSYQACRIGQLVCIWQPLIGSSFRL
jgi:hypothetical protein